MSDPRIKTRDRVACADCRAVLFRAEASGKPRWIEATPTDSGGYALIAWGEGVDGEGIYLMASRYDPDVAGEVCFQVHYCRGRHANIA